MNKEEIFSIIVFTIGIFIGIIIAISFVQLEISPQWVTDQTCNNFTNQAYQQGIVDVANFTTYTGNFTYIYNNSIETQGVQDYCVDMIQNLNSQQEEKKTWQQ